MEGVVGKMNVYYNNQCTLIKSFSSRGELENYILKYKDSMLIESSSGYDNIYEVISLSDNREFCLAIMYNWQGIESNCVIIPKLNHLLLAFECDLVWIDVTNRKILAQDIFPLPIYTLKYIEKQGIVVVLYEMGVAVYDKNAKKLWEIGTSDIIVDYSINAETISIESTDGNKVTFSTFNGKGLE